MSAFNLHTIDLMVSLSKLAVEESHSKCRQQLQCLYNQRQTLLINRKKRLAREASQNEELRALYSSLGLIERVE
jgi:hypothetical protein